VVLCNAVISIIHLRLFLLRLCWELFDILSWKSEAECNAIFLEIVMNELRKLTISADFFVNSSFIISRCSGAWSVIVYLRELTANMDITLLLSKPRCPLATLFYFMYRMRAIIIRLWILTINKGRIFWKKPPWQNVFYLQKVGKK
jgi:hypothetical protein